MKKVILLTLFLLFTILVNAQDNWLTFKNYPTDLIIDLKNGTDTNDTPFVFTNRKGGVYHYLLPVKFTPIIQEELTDINIKIKSIGASYDLKGRLMIYFRGKIDISCCYQASISLEFYDENNNLIQLAKTDELGNFKVKSINGNMIEISKGRIKFNFTKIKTFDGNGDVRFAKIEFYEQPIDEQFVSLTSKSNKVVTTEK